MNIHMLRAPMGRVPTAPREPRSAKRFTIATLIASMSLWVGVAGCGEERTGRAESGQQKSGSASGGQVTNRYRVNHYGDRQLNRALHTVVQSRIRHHDTTHDYVARRTTEGKTSREITCCLARYIARDLYRLLESGPAMA